MERWENCVAVVTGAGSGIGEAIAKQLVLAGLRVVALGLQQEPLSVNREKLPEEDRHRYFPLMCNVTNEEDVDITFKWIKDNFGGTDILVNNADDVLCGGDIDKVAPDVLDEVVNLTMRGLILCTQAAFRSMKERNFSGHILNINNIGGRQIYLVDPNNTGKIYTPAKKIFTSINEQLQQELKSLGLQIRTTSVSPGRVRTEQTSDDEDIPTRNVLMPENVAKAVVFAISTPPHVQVHEVLVKPVPQRI